MKIRNSMVTLAVLLAALCILPSTRAEVITAGELIVDLRNEDLAAVTNTWVNHATSTNSVGDFARLDTNVLTVVPGLGDGTNYANALQVNAIAANSVVGDMLTPPVLTGNNSRSVEAWIYANSLNGSSTPVGWGNSGNGAMSSFRYTDNSGNGMFSGWFADVGWSGAILPVGQWVYVVWTYDGATVNGYINGNPASSGALTLATSTNLLVVGAGRDATTDAFDGYIGDVRVHTGVLSSDDVVNNYAEGMVAPDLSPSITGLDDASVFVGQTFTLEPTISGGLPLFYQWSSNSVEIAGATNATLSLTNLQLSANGTEYSLAVSNSFGIAEDSMILTVETVADIGPVTINLDVTSGGEYEGTAIAPGTGTAWNQIANTSGSTYTITGALDSHGNVLDSVEITMSKSGTIYIYNATAEEKGNPNPLDLMSDYAFQGPYTIEIFGLPVGEYDLYVYAHGDNSGQVSTITVATTNGGYIAATTDAGEYRNIYQDGALNNSYVAITGSVTSATDSWGSFTFTSSAYLNGFQIQNAHPVIEGLADMEVETGTNLVIDAGVAGRAPFTYQWSYNGSDLPGETGPTLTLDNVQSGDAGVYGLVVGNSIGSATNSFALTVGGGGPITIDAINVVGGMASISWTSDAGDGFSIESSPSLTTPSWLEVTNVSSVGTQTTEVPVSGDDQEFYRISK